MEFIEYTYYIESSLPIKRAAMAIAAEQEHPELMRALEKWGGKGNWSGFYGK